MCLINRLKHSLLVRQKKKALKLEHLEITREEHASDVNNARWREETQNGVRISMFFTHMCTVRCRVICSAVSLSALLDGLPMSYLCALQCAPLYTVYSIHQGGWEIQLPVGFSSGSS